MVFDETYQGGILVDDGSGDPFRRAEPSVVMTQRGPDETSVRDSLYIQAEVDFYPFRAVGVSHPACMEGGWVTLDSVSPLESRVCIVSV